MKVIKLGDRVKLSKKSDWYCDIKESVGIVVYIKGEDVKVEYKFDGFLGDYEKLHKCSINEHNFKYSLKEKFIDIGSGYHLIEKGYNLNLKHLIRVGGSKKGNIDLF